MPTKNLRGGKGFKKGKKTPASETELPFFSRTEGQDFARVIRLLGDRRVVCFCNDGETRVCKIRGALCRGPNKQRIMCEDIVLISLRDFEEDTTAVTHHGAGAKNGETLTTQDVAITASGRKEIGDIIHKYARSHYRRIRNEYSIHPKLFVEAVGATVGEEDIFAEDGGEEADDKEATDSDGESGAEIDIAAI